MNRVNALTAPRKRILIADDVEEWRVLIRKLLESRPELEIVYEACDGQQAFEKHTNSSLMSLCWILECRS